MSKYLGMKTLNKMRFKIKSRVEYIERGSAMDGIRPSTFVRSLGTFPDRNPGILNI